MNTHTSSRTDKALAPISASSRWRYLAFLAVIGALVYLPFADKLGLFKDDWYLIFDAHTQGSGFFHEVYAIDRPARAYVMQLFYELFGDRILYYHLSAYVYRVLAAWALFRALDLVWRDHKPFHFLSALFFMVYPGFLSQINPIDYQAQILSLWLAMVSILFTLYSIKSTSRPQKFIWLVLSVLTGMIYPALVEYFIGLEVLRLGLVIQFCRQQGEKIFSVHFIKRVTSQWMPSLTGPAAFLIWRLFLFESERRSTDVSLQIGQLFTSPLTGLWWLVNWVQDIFRVVFLAWAIPFHNLAFGLRLRDTFLGLGIGLLAAFLAVVCYAGTKWMSTESSFEQPDPAWRSQTLLTGFATAAFALIPVIIVNRHADFGEYTRYALASGVGVAMMLSALLAYLNSSRMKLLIIAGLTLIAGTTHFSNAVRGALETEEVRIFWWQVAWRAPDIQTGITLIASYPSAPIQEDYFIWGPANLIYRPGRQNVIPIEIKIPAAVLTPDVINQIISGEGEETPLRRGNFLTRSFNDVVFLVQSHPSACMRVINGDAPELSVFDSERTKLLAPYSNPKAILSNGETPTPPSDIFGDEPHHEWCYYYQKADLARQRGDWDEVARLGDEAQKLGLLPVDAIEWLPFLQAYALLEDQKQVKILSTRINADSFYQEQACRYLIETPPHDFVLTPEMRGYVEKLFCE
ncbi:MAG: hypothetical protein AB1607_16350 [Chloroflexota bacterium]